MNKAVPLVIALAAVIALAVAGVTIQRRFSKRPLTECETDADCILTDGRSCCSNCCSAPTGMTLTLHRQIEARCALKECDREDCSKKTCIPGPPIESVKVVCQHAACTVVPK